MRIPSKLLVLAVVLAIGLATACKGRHKAPAPQGQPERFRITDYRVVVARGALPAAEPAARPAAEPK